MTSFSELGLAAPLLRALDEAGYTTPTPIQAQAIPLVLEGRDLLGIAQTGTGKTAAFALPILHQLAAKGGRPPRGGCRVLILSPTRELASQIADAVKTYGGHLGFSVATVFGGVPHGPQRRALSAGVDVVVATPGRLLDHLAAGTARLDRVETLVLDEADQMLDKGFLPAIRKLIPTLPRQRQTLFFSATMPQEIGRLAGDLLNNPARVEVAPVATTAERVNQRILHVETGRKRALLARLLQGEGVGRTLVFARTKHGADRVVKQLEQDGLSANAIHGNKSQGQRERALQEFRDGIAPILVATDIAARGIDVDNVTARHPVRPAGRAGELRPPHRPHRARRRLGRGRGPASRPRSWTSSGRSRSWSATPIPAEDHRQDQSVPVARAPANGKSAGRPQQHRGGGGQGRGRGAPGGGAPRSGAPRPQGRPAAPPRGPDAGQTRRRAMPAAIATVGRKDRRWRDADFRESGAAPSARDATWRVGGED